MTIDKKNSSPRRTPRKITDPAYRAELELIKNEYMRGKNLSDLVELFPNISKYTLHKYIFVGTPTQAPWCKERKQFHNDITAEARELAKVNASKAYRKGTELLEKVYAKFERKLAEEEDISISDLAQLIKTLSSGVALTFKMSEPHMRQPLLNINASLAPELTPQQIEEKLKAQGIMVIDHKNADEEDNAS